MHANRWRRELAGASETAVPARRIARKTLFAVAGLVSIHDNIWTTDRIKAAQRFGVIRPQLATSLDTLIAWGGGDATRPSRSDVQTVLDRVVAEVVEDFASRIGLWRPPNSASPR